MQAITLAIGKQGIDFFTQHYLADALSALLKKMTPPDKIVPVPNFTGGVTGDSYDYSNIKINLTGGSLLNFSAALNKVVQGVGSDGKTPVFNVNMQALNFQAQYNWVETFHYIHTYITIPFGSPVWHHDPGDSSNRFSYSPGFGQLDVAIVIQFSFNKDKNQWEFTVQKAMPNASNISANIPGASILQDQDYSCTKNHVDDATAQTIDAIDFATPVNQSLSGIVQTIPGSGNLGNGIVYDFSTGDSGVVFPNNKGIQIGVKGGASYQGASFPPDTGKPLALPLPPGDDDAHHLVMYVSNYEVDALNWAFFKADKLNAVVNADDLKNDSYVLKVKTYVQSCPELKPYSTRAMQAQITPHAAPTTSFQVVYQLTAAVMAALKSSGSLPTDTYNNLNGLQGNNYVSVESLETDLSASGIEQKYFSTIEQAARNMGMVVTHNIDYTLIIQDFQPTQPTIVFNVQRTDILSNPALGLGGDKNQAQTLQFDFINVSWASTFVSSSIPKLNAAAFSGLWLNAGEPQYDKLMADLGKNGVPLPIMSGFQFDFDNAQVSVQENYISILANVMYK